MNHFLRLSGLLLAAAVYAGLSGPLPAQPPPGAAQKGKQDDKRTVHEVCRSEPLKIEGKLVATDDKDVARKRGKSNNGSGPECFCKVYHVKMFKDRKYTMRLNRTGGNFDPFLRVEDSAGKEVAFDDDSGGELNSLINFECTKDDTFRIIATTWGGNSTGDFVVLIEAVE